MDQFKAINFNDLYRKQKERSTFRPKSRREWNEKAEGFNARMERSRYIWDLISRMDTGGCETVLDVGCGTGHLSLELARKMRSVNALDFSPAMLEKVRENAVRTGASNVQTHLLAWEDAWDAVEPADLVIASRSLEVEDLARALDKLDRFAKKRVYLTYMVGESFVDPFSQALLGRSVVPRPDYIYVINVLYQMGIHPTLEYIKGENRFASFYSPQDYIQSVRWSLGDLGVQEIELLEAGFWELPQDSSGARVLSSAVDWALIGWESKSNREQENG